MDNKSSNDQGDIPEEPTEVYCQEIIRKELAKSYPEFIILFDYLLRIPGIGGFHIDKDQHGKMHLDFSIYNMPSPHIDFIAEKTKNAQLTYRIEFEDGVIVFHVTPDKKNKQAGLRRLVKILIDLNEYLKSKVPNCQIEPKKYNKIAREYCKRKLKKYFYFSCQFADFYCMI